MTDSTHLAGEHHQFRTGVHADELLLPYRSLVELFERSVENYAERAAYIVSLPNGAEACLTYADLEKWTRGFAIYLRTVAKISPGDRVAVQLPNVLAYAVAAWGIIRCGGVIVNLNPMATATETGHYLRESGASVYIGLDLFQSRFAKVIEDCKIRTSLAASALDFFFGIKGTILRTLGRVAGKRVPARKPFRSFVHAIEQGLAQENSEWRHAPQESDLAALQFTGGTTGVSKAAQLSHKNLLSNVQQLRRGTADDPCCTGTGLSAIPLYHILAFTNGLLLFASGGTNVLIPNPRPIENLRPAFSKHHFTWMVGVNALYKALLEKDWFRYAPPRSLRICAAGGYAVERSVAQDWEKLVGCPLCEGWGLTEASPVLTSNLFAKVYRLGTVGLAAPKTEIRIVDEEGNECPIGTPGELLVRGPQIMLGYWNRPKETKQVLSDDGWLSTGDIGCIDADGFISIVDRKKDLIIVSGFNVFPKEVEECIMEINWIVEAAVVSVFDEKTGERPVAFIVLDGKQTPENWEEAIRAHCKEKMTNYKIPIRYHRRDDLPRTPVGKVLRRDLKEIAKTL